MASNYYGQNTTHTKAVMQALAPYLLAHPELHWAVLLDSAFDYEAGAAPSGLGQPINCYSGLDDLDDLAPVAPCLYPIDATADGCAGCEALLDHASARPMLSIVASFKPLKDLAETWAPLHWVYASDPEDKQRFALRFADSRSLQALPSLLPPSAWQALRSPLAFWFLVNRAGELEALPAAPEGTQASSRIALSANAMGKMLEQAMPDTLLQQLVERAFDDIDTTLPHLALFKWMQDAHALGAESGLGNMNDLGALAYGTLLSKGAVLENEKVQALLRDKAFVPGRLDEALAALDVV